MKNGSKARKDVLNKYMQRIAGSINALAWAIVLGAGFIFVAPNNALAVSIDPGFDLLTTPIGGGVLDLSPFGGPSVVPLEGDPIGPGDTDTIVERKTGLPDGGTGTIDIEIVALSLRSVDPVNISGTFFDVFISLDPSTPSIGEINVLTHDANGGTFDSFFDVFTRIDLVPVGSPFSIPPVFRQDQITSTGTAWSHTPTDFYPTIPNLPSGNFYLTSDGIEHSGPHPRVLPASDTSPVPEPATLVLLSTGLLGLIGYSYRGRNA
jgi:hypothetical protein